MCVCVRSILGGVFSSNEPQVMTKKDGQEAGLKPKMGPGIGL